nr:retrotransposon protein, putative, Ty3-gypsy subclass [Tanacetum cinerariifolium]
NVVADALNRKSGMIAGIKVEEEIIRDQERLDIEIYVRGQHGYWSSLRIEPDLISRIKEAQKEDNEIWTIVENLDKQRDVATFVSRCLICEHVKIEHQRASGLLQPLNIPIWKWDKISMDFVTGLPRTQRRYDAIWVVVDRLTKSAHFLPIRKDYSTDGQNERTIQTLEDMLCSCALEWTCNWDDYICLVEFGYNNSWHASIKCAPF